MPLFQRNPKKQPLEELLQGIPLLTVPEIYHYSGKYKIVKPPRAFILPAEGQIHLQGRFKVEPSTVHNMFGFSRGPWYKKSHWEVMLDGSTQETIDDETRIFIPLQPIPGYFVGFSNGNSDQRHPISPAQVLGLQRKKDILPLLCRIDNNSKSTYVGYYQNGRKVRCYTFTFKDDVRAQFDEHINLFYQTDELRDSNILQFRPKKTQ